MSPFTALNEGASRVLRLPKLVVLFYLLNLIAAAVAIAPAVVLIGGRLSHSFENDRLYSNVDIAWIIETLSHFEWWPITGVGVTVAAVGILYFVLNTYLAGGAISVLHRDDEPFFSAGARYFLRLFRLMLISLIFYAAVLLFNVAMNAAIARVRESSMESHTWTILHWIQLAIVFFLLGVVNMIFDYAKVICIAGVQRSAIRATSAALRFTARNLFRTLTTYWVCAGVGLAILLLYHLITEASGQSSPVTIALVFVLRQLYMLVRMWLRLWTWSSELQLYTFNSTIVAPEPPSLAVAG